MNFYLGCAVWSYKEWVGNLYPSKSQPRDFLKLYGKRFTTVEGNTTFYAIPDSAVVAKWAAQTPTGFKFCPKLHRQITHRGLLAPQIDNALSFLTRMSGLGDRLGTTFIQLPPSYSPACYDDLETFLSACCQTNLSLALEVRHLDWFTANAAARLNNLLARLNIARVLLDTRPIYDCPDDPQLNSPRKKPQVPLQATITNNTALIRFISHPLERYNRSYLQQWAIDVAGWLNSGKTVYFMVHCPQEVRSPDTARQFYRLLLQQEVIDLPNLPWNTLTPDPIQLELF